MEFVFLIAYLVIGLFDARWWVRVIDSWDNGQADFSSVLPWLVPAVVIWPVMGPIGLFVYGNHPGDQPGVWFFGRLLGIKKYGKDAGKHDDSRT